MKLNITLDIQDAEPSVLCAITTALAQVSAPATLEAVTLEAEPAPAPKAEAKPQPEPEPDPEPTAVAETETEPVALTAADLQQLGIDYVRKDPNGRARLHELLNEYGVRRTSELPACHLAEVYERVKGWLAA